MAIIKCKGSYFEQKTKNKKESRKNIKEKCFQKNKSRGISIHKTSLKNKCNSKKPGELVLNINTSYKFSNDGYLSYPQSPREYQNPKKSHQKRNSYLEFPIVAPKKKAKKMKKKFKLCDFGLSKNMEDNTTSYNPHGEFSPPEIIKYGPTDKRVSLRDHSFIVH